MGKICSLLHLLCSLIQYCFTWDASSSCQAWHVALEETWTSEVQHFRECTRQTKNRYIRNPNPSQAKWFPPGMPSLGRLKQVSSGPAWTPDCCLSQKKKKKTKKKLSEGGEGEGGLEWGGRGRRWGGGEKEGGTQRKKKKAEEEEEEGQRGKEEKEKEAWSVPGIQRHSLELQVGDGEILQDANGGINAEFFSVDIITVRISGVQCSTLISVYAV